MTQYIFWPYGENGYWWWGVPLTKWSLWSLGTKYVFWLIQVSGYGWPSVNFWLNVKISSHWWQNISVRQSKAVISADKTMSFDWIKPAVFGNTSFPLVESNRLFLVAQCISSDRFKSLIMDDTLCLLTESNTLLLMTHYDFDRIKPMIICNTVHLPPNSNKWLTANTVCPLTESSLWFLIELFALTDSGFAQFKKSKWRRTRPWQAFVSFCVSWCTS